MQRGVSVPRLDARLSRGRWQVPPGFGRGAPIGKPSGRGYNIVINNVISYLEVIITRF